MNVSFMSIEPTGGTRLVLRVNTDEQIPGKEDVCRFQAADTILVFRVVEKSFVYLIDPDRDGAMITKVLILMTQVGSDPIPENKAS